MKKFFRTLYDIGIYRIYLRIIYESKAKVDLNLPDTLLLKLYRIPQNVPQWSPL